MRVLLVGSASSRARIRAQLAATSIEVVAEFSSLAAARESGLESDASIMSPGRSIDNIHVEGGRHGDDDTEDDLKIDPLTPREVQVLELLAEGLPNKAIADRLNISDQTVKFHVSSISTKLGAANRTDAVRRAVRRGLITL